jgi:polyferredoxin
VARSSGRWTRLRRWVQLACLAIFTVLPLFDWFRFDFAAGRLHLFGTEIWLDEWTLLWLALMFAMWLVGALSLIFGRVYCSFACPQMVFTEIAHDLDALGRRLTRRFRPPLRTRLARGFSLSALAVVSVAVSVLMMGYFAPLGEVVRHLARFDVGPWIGLLGAATAVVTFLDFAFVRETFCRAVCPYGLLQGLLEDGRSLHVALDPTPGACIECQACVRVCPMAIDIRAGAFQIECTRCGSCIDACDAILGRLKPPRRSVLAFRLPGFSLASLDAKRVLVALATVGFGAVLAASVLGRERIALQLSPVYTESGGRTASNTAADIAEARFLLRAANRGSEPVALAARPEGLPPTARIEGLADPTVPAGQERRFDLVVRVPLADTRGSVTPFVWVVEGAGEAKRFDAALLARGRRSP